MYKLDRLDRKLAEWAGFKLIDTQFYEHSFGNSEVESWDYPDGKDCGLYVPNFTESLDACFKWLVPKLTDSERARLSGEFKHDGTFTFHWFWDNPALALCLTIEKLIDKEGKNV